MPSARNLCRLFCTAAIVLTVAAGSALAAAAQTPARGAAPKPAAPAAPANVPKINATMLQLMRGIVYPASNVVFAAQDDLSKQVPAADPATSPNPLTSTYGGWVAVENAGLAIAESATLITMPGRLCSSGKRAPVQRADWIRFANGVRVAGVGVYEAAKKKNQDAIVDAAGTLSDACSMCHDVYREKKGGEKDRCLP